MQYDSGRHYLGEWEDDLRSGRGIEHYSNGNSFIGSFANGKAEGMGIYR